MAKRKIVINTTVERSCGSYVLKDKDGFSISSFDLAGRTKDGLGCMLGDKVKVTIEKVKK